MNCLLWTSVTVLSLVWAIGGQSSDGDVRLIDSSGLTGGSSGRLEIYYDNQWGTVCDDNFTSNDARVACRQLGYADYTNYGRVGTLGFSEPLSSTPIWLDELGCLGTESRLINCPANTIGDDDCYHSEDIALVCTANGDLRLVGNSGQTGGSSGRLEVYSNGTWGTVCDDNFGSNDASVACRQLGFSTYTQYGNVGMLSSDDISSSSPIWLDELSCLGTESRLIDCPDANIMRVGHCSHSEDVTLVCSSSASTTSTPSTTGSTSTSTSTSSSPSLSSDIVSVGAGVATSIIIVAIIIFFLMLCGFIYSRRRRVGRPATRIRTSRSVASATPTIVIIAKSSKVAKEQDTAYPTQSRNKHPSYSNQTPKRKVSGSQPVTVNPTGQYADPSGSYPTAYFQQPSAPYYTEELQYPAGPPPAQYPTGQPPPAQYPTGQPPPAQYPTGQPQYFDGGGVPPAYYPGYGAKY